MGAGALGELGNNSTPTQSLSPVAVYTGGVLSGLTLTQITAGTQLYTCALSSAGRCLLLGQ
jgi:hypothetical protein